MRIGTGLRLPPDVQRKSLNVHEHFTRPSWVGAAMTFTFHDTASPTMLEEALDPRPSLPHEFARLLTGSAAVPAVSVETLAQIWNDDASFWSNLRTLEYWTDRARR